MSFKNDSYLLGRCSIYMELTNDAINNMGIFTEGVVGISSVSLRTPVLGANAKMIIIEIYFNEPLSKEATSAIMADMRKYIDSRGNQKKFDYGIGDITEFDDEKKTYVRKGIKFVKEYR